MNGGPDRLPLGHAHSIVTDRRLFECFGTTAPFRCRHVETPQRIDRDVSSASAVRGRSLGRALDVASLAITLTAVAIAVRLMSRRRTGCAAGQPPLNEQKPLPVPCLPSR